MERHVIGICGNKFNGKDTIADHLVKTYGYTKISFGDPLKHAIQEIFGFSNEQLWGNEKENIDPYWNVKPREIMQFIGTDCLRIQFGNQYTHIGDKIWVLTLQKKIDSMFESGITKIVIPDVRFPNESKMIVSLSTQYPNTICSVFKVHRKDLDNIGKDTHISENLLNQIVVNHTFENITIEQLRNDVDVVMDAF